MISEISQTEKDKYCMVSLICGILKKHVELIEIESRMVEWWLPGAEGCGETNRERLLKRA